jgi:hypothetical protein
MLRRGRRVVNLLLSAALVGGAISSAWWLHRSGRVPPGHAMRPVDQPVAADLPPPANKSPLPPSADGEQSAPAKARSPARRVRWTLLTTPSGATVLATDGSALGKTPWRHLQAAAPGVQTLRLRLNGYKEERVELDREQQEQYRVRMHRQRQAWSMAPVH